MNASQFMDKQIMDLANSPNGSDFINLINPQDERKEEITPSYDFQPIRPAGSTNTEQDNGGARAWNSADSKNSIGIRNVSSLDSIGPAKTILEKDHTASNEVLLSAIDQTMKKYADSLLQTLEGVSSRISQLESRSRHLENAMDDLRISVGSNQDSTDGKLRQVENILREVQSSVQVVKDKQDVIESQLHLAKLQLPKTEQHSEIQNTPQSDSFQHSASLPQQSYQQLSAPPSLQPPSTLSQPNPSSQQTPPPPGQFPNQFVPPNQVNPIHPPREPYFPPQSQMQEGGSQPYQLPPPQQPQPQPTPPLPAPPQQHYQAPPQPQYSQPPPPQPHQQHPSVPPLNSPQPSLGHRPEEQPYPPPHHNFPPNLHQASIPAAGTSPSQQFYGAPSHMYEPPSSRVNSGFPSAAYGPSSGSNEPYPYGGSHQYGGPPSLSSSGSMKQQGGGGSYPQLPTARILPQGPPTASAIGGSGSSTGGGNRVPIDDVVDKVTTMGFSRDQVRATVRKLTESGQTVDLNTVLDKLMNEGEGQPPRAWFGR